MGKVTKPRHYLPKQQESAVYTPLDGTYRKNWQACSSRIQKTIRGPRNTQKKLNFAEVPIDGYYIPTIISLDMQEQSNTRAKKILLIIANSIKTSVRKCLTGTY